MEKIIRFIRSAAESAAKDGRAINKKRNSLRYKLFRYMFALAAILLAAFLIGFSVINAAAAQRNGFRSALRMQMTVFSENLSSISDTLAVWGLQMSDSVTDTMRQYLNGHRMSFSELNDSQSALASLQDALFDPLREKLLQTDSSGVFLMLDATVNTALPDADRSRSGIYIRKNSPSDSESDLLLYHGVPDIGKEHGAMPHRKWRLEFQTDLLPGYDAWKKDAVSGSCSFSDIFVLPGTSDKALLMMFPLFSSDGIFWGVCGFEINDSFFRQKMAQPTTLRHLTCILADSKAAAGGPIDPEHSMACGSTDGYYLAPAGTLTVTKKYPDGRIRCSDRVNSYLGVAKRLGLTDPGGRFRAYVLIPLVDYRRIRFQETIRILLILAILLCFSVYCCRYFSRRFLTPVLNSLEQLKNRKKAEPEEPIPEIDGLFTLFSELERDREARTSALEQEIEQAHSELSRINREYDDAKRELSRLVYSRKKEVDPDNYRQFLSGLKTLTKTETKIFRLYLSGKGTKEIMEEENIKESTLRYHNRNIYSKLGINSMKQLLRYAAIMNGEDLV
ncbi:MAG: LuxR C-terminal-related transcriptional regulator [Lachnospiraceae bacterium]|jgi:DNA-binding CsgD family transcriptional regulator|nr:LuxR C-terminal-related transcriptional regulator [Lachnospiraceae bacterium]MCI1327794.1 LuxR C-terminal-related transcriptional regulator [Lachnospiraceae bacterium]